MDVNVKKELYLITPLVKHDLLSPNDHLQRGAGRAKHTPKWFSPFVREMQTQL